MSKNAWVSFALTSLALTGALFFVSPTQAFAAFEFSSVDDDISASSNIVTGSVTAEQRLHLDQQASSGSGILFEAADRTMPTLTVSEADEREQFETDLADGKSVDAESYLATLEDEVSWTSSRASTYGVGDGLLGSRCADGSVVTLASMGVAHKTLPLGSTVQIVCGNRVVNAVVHDRGPYVAGRDIDLQPAVAAALGVSGVAPITYRVLD